MHIRKKVEVRIERVSVLALAWHDNDEFLFCNAAKLRDRGAIVQNVLDHVGADHRIEVLVRERQVFDFRRNIFDAFYSFRVFDNKIDAGKMLYVRPLQSNYVKQVTRTASDVAYIVTNGVGDDPFNASV